MRPKASSIRILLATSLLLLGGTAPAEAQSATTLGYFGYTTLGMAVGGGLGALTGTECDGFICIPPGVVVGVLTGGTLGLIAGGELSASVQASRQAGQPLTSGQMAALTVGSTLGGAAMGALVSSLLIRGEGAGTPLGSDERTFGILALAGAGFGVYRAIAFRKSIVPESVRIRPDVMRDGRPGVRVSIRF